MGVQAGLWCIDGKPVDRELLVQIIESVAEYGPDGQMAYFEGPVGMMYRPFHTTRESRNEQQPQLCSAQNVLTWDGRLDNRDELIANLSHDMTGDQSDVAIVAAAFRCWGLDSFAKLIGDWALAIWNPAQRELILARDFMGIKPLFYYSRAQSVLWCSHLAPLALCGDRLTLSDDYVAGYLAFHPDAHLTPYREIRAVPPGKYIRIRSSNTTVHDYWTFNPQAKTRYKTHDEYEEEYRHLFRQAVRRRLRTDSPVLGELSGGLDSSSIICMADDIAAKEGAQSPSIDTFSYYDSLEPGEDDLPHLARVEEWRGRCGFHMDSKGSGDSLRFEEPGFVATPGFGCRSEIKAALSEIGDLHKYRVMLCGTGGDELNGQPLDPRVQMADSLVHFRVVNFGALLMAWSPRMRLPLVHLLAQTLLQFFPAGIRNRLNEAGRLEPWIDGTFAKKYRLSARQNEVMEGLWFLNPSVRDVAQTLATLKRQLTYTSPSRLEKRYPYLDQNLVEYLTTIPLEQLLRPGQRRSLMRRALRDILPPAILARRTKTGAARCYSVTLAKHWPEVHRILSSPLVSRLGYVDRDRMYEALIEMRNGRIPRYFLRLLKALALELWLRDADARKVLSIQHLTSPVVSKFAQMEARSSS